MRVPSEQMRQRIAKGHPYFAEIAAVRCVEYIDLPAGHWPQFTKPAGMLVLGGLSSRS